MNARILGAIVLLAGIGHQHLGRKTIQTHYRLGCLKWAVDASLLIDGRRRVDGADRPAMRTAAAARRCMPIVTYGAMPVQAPNGAEVCWLTGSP